MNTAKQRTPKASKKMKPLYGGVVRSGKPTDTNQSRVVRRRVIRLANYLNKTVDLAYLIRDEAKKRKRLDNIHTMTEIIFNCKRGLAHLNNLSKDRFFMSLDQLSSTYS